MNTINKWVLISALALLSACGATKSYFTQDVRKKIEDRSVSLEQVQFYVDRDIELRREVNSGQLDVTSGKVKFENGRYLHIILLKRGTPGVCVQAKDKTINVSFETGDNKTLTFGVPSGGKTGGYQICAEEWKNNLGKVTYDGEVYTLQPAGAAAALMIKKSVVDHLEVKVRKMKGRKI
jgi:hypothetical protein